MKNEKFERYVRLYRSVLEEDPNDGYMLYQLGKLYYSAQRFEEAYEPLAACASQQHFGQLYYPPMLVMFGYTLKQLKCSAQAMELLQPLLPLFPQYPDLPFLLGMLAMELGDFGKIERYFKQALAIGETNRYTTVVGTGSYRAAHNLGVFCEVTGRAAEARRNYKRAAEYGFGPSLARLEELSMKS